MRTSEEYRRGLYKMRPNIYIDGEVVSRDDPRITPGINVIATTYDLARDPAYAGVMTADSHISGNKINRFCHIHQSVDDLLSKQKMTRLYCQKTGGCIQRCMGIDSMNALSVVTLEIDKAKGTDYNKRFLKYLQYFQEKDLCANCAQTDVKGDRRKRPHEQVDPDLYLRIVERRKDGIVVRGAKAHNTIAPYADEIIVLPTRTLTEEEEDWAVAFALPADTPGIHLVCRPSSYRPRKQLKAPIVNYGDVESLTIFDNVFVPWERVFMCGEREFGGRLALLFALYHRHSYTGCKPAFTDVLMGAAALVAEYNGIEAVQHVRHKLADMVGVAELVFAAGIAAGVKGSRAESGTYIPEVVFCNVGRRHAGENVYHEYQTVADLAGGLAGTLPPEGDFYNEITGPLLHKYIMRNPKITAENQHRCFRMISDLVCSGHGALNQIAALHGGGSPIMETIAILGNYDLEAKKKIVKYLAGITD
ncbi:MAG: aromatic ring hydroxylase [Chloroflexi bacterium]|nr:aromatic ring hydroxylase [Chloroflexota bacterium]